MSSFYRILIVIAVSLVLSLLIAVVIDTNHIRFMMGNCPGNCPSIFPTPLFFIVFFISFPLILFLGLVISGLTGFGSRSSGSEFSKAGNNNIDLETNFRSIRRLLPRLEREVLDYIVEHGGVVSQANIARDLGIGKVRAWRVIQRLEKKGLVEVYKVKGRNMVKVKKLE